jgi:hypothetical protein
VFDLGGNWGLKSHDQKGAYFLAQDGARAVKKKSGA